jgi:hypothetical protein
MRKRYASTQLHEQLLGAGERDHARAPRGQLSLQSIERDPVVIEMRGATTASRPTTTISVRRMTTWTSHARKFRNGLFEPRAVSQVEIHMTNELEPRVDQWYSFRSKDGMFRVVAVDDGAIEIQSFDGDIEEVDLGAWRALDIESAEPPEDWTGPFDNIEADELDDSESAMRKGDAHARREPGFRQGDAWQDARPTDEEEEEDDGRLAASYTQDAEQPAKNKRH